MADWVSPGMPSSADVRGTASRSSATPGVALLQSIGGLPGAILRVGLRLGTAIVRDVQGHTLEQPFHRGRLDDTRDAARRATVVLATSLAPDSYVLRLPVDEETILIHAITQSSPGTDPRWAA